MTTNYLQMMIDSLKKKKGILIRIIELNEEQNQIKQHAEQFNLHLTFAQVADRAYIGGVKVAITDAKGNEVFKDDNLGPLLYLKLNPGQYTLSMDYQGQVKTESVQLESNKTQEIVVTW